MLDKFKHALSHNLIHIVGTKILENVPSEVLVRHSGTLLIAHGFGVDPQFAIEECGVLHFAIPVACVLFFLQLLVVEHLHEEYICHLFEYGYGVGDASHKEGVPNLVDLVFYFACYHISVCMCI